MKKFLRFLGEELREVLPATVFFLVLFHLVSLTRMLVLSEYSITLAGSATATILALIVAKVILIADALPFMKLARQRPLIWATLWRTLVYGILVVLAQYLEELIPGWLHTGSFAAANNALFDEIVRTHFLGVHLWLLVGILVYCAATELIDAVGADRVREMFFGSRDSAPA